MKTEHRVILAIALSAAFFILWFTVINPTPKREAPAPKREVEAAQEEKGPPPETKKEVAREGLSAGEERRPTSRDPQAHLPTKTWTISNELVDVQFTTDGGVPTKWIIKGYRTGTDPKSPPIDLAKVPPQLPPPLSLSFEEEDFPFPERPRFELAAADESHVVFKWRSPKVEVKKTIRFKKEDYTAEVTVDIINKTNRPIKGRPVLTWSGQFSPRIKKGLFGFAGQPPVESSTPVYYLDGKVHRERKVGALAERVELGGQVYWSGLESRYFLAVVIPRVQGVSVEYGAEELESETKGARGLWAGVMLPSKVVPAGESGEAKFSIYAGPKEINYLKGPGVHLDKAIDYGWFTIISVPILYLLKFFYSVIHNYGIAIILLTIFVKLLLHPINVKSLRSMKAMQQLQPQLKELQKKYKGDKARLNQGTMQLFRAHKVNPMGGCLPMLLQFPIYIALYKVLWNSIELYHAPFFWFYRDLSAPDPYYITPVLLGVFMVAQQKLMPSATADPAQKKMMMIMPVMFSVFMLFLPAGLVIYILVNTVTSVTQQWMHNKGIGFIDLVRGKWKTAKA